MTDVPFDLESAARAIPIESSSASHAPPDVRPQCGRLSPETLRTVSDFVGRGWREPSELMIAFHLLDRGAWSGALEILRLIAPPARDRRLAASLLYARGVARLMGGPAGPAIHDCARALRLLEPGTQPMAAARIRRLAFRAYRRTDDLDRARRCLDRIREAVPWNDIGEAAILIRRCEADLMLDERRFEAAAAAYRDTVTLLETEGATAGTDSRLSAALRGWAEALIALDRWTEAREKVDRALSFPDALADIDPAELGRIGHLEARLAAEAEDEVGLFRAFDRAEQSMRGANAEEDLALLLISRAEAVFLRVAGGPMRERSQQDLIEAQSILRRLGRARDAARCDLLLEAGRRTCAVTETGATAPIRRPPRVPRSRRLTHLGFLTCDPATLAALEPLESLGRTQIPILILGESGTGKEVLARALHRAAGLRGSFVPVNCGALPSDLQESELFGHVRGAFTGAIADKTGLFEAANGGTLLLDEIGEMSPRAQVKLLRILELGEVRRVGETKTRRVQVRVIAATNADPIEGIRSGAFRLDLYYRLCGLSVQLPPLRDRMADVPLLAAHFARLFWDRETPPPVPTPAALDRLLRHDWPGNVRELRFTMERAIAWTSALERNCVEADVVEVKARAVPTPEAPEELEEDEVARAGGLDAYLARVERRLILQALERNGWNRARAARSLGGMSRTTLIGKMKRLGLFPNGSEPRESDSGNPLGL